MLLIAVLHPIKNTTFRAQSHLCVLEWRPRTTSEFEVQLVQAILFHQQKREDIEKRKNINQTRSDQEYRFREEVKVDCTRRCRAYLARAEIEI